MDNVIAERKLLYALKNSPVQKEMTIKIGAPYWIDNDVASCPFELEGLFDLNDVQDARGADLIQALQFAVNVDFILEKLRKKYDFYWPTGEPYFDDDQSEN
jgi:hypothetical protein